ncbi:MAG: hypothetical protein WA364_24505 [Candidatus Nitrosopolaris sp.]
MQQRRNNGFIIFALLAYRELAYSKIPKELTEAESLERIRDNMEVRRSLEERIVTRGSF